MPENPFFAWSSYILNWASFLIGVVSLIASFLGYKKAKKASIEAEQVNNRITSNDKRKALAEDWSCELEKLAPSGRERVNGLITLLTRISNCELISERQKEHMQRLLSSIKCNIDDVDSGLFRTKLDADMNEAVGIIETIIDSFLPTNI